MDQYLSAGNQVAFDDHCLADIAEAFYYASGLYSNGQLAWDWGALPVVLCEPAKLVVLYPLYRGYSWGRWTLVGLYVCILPAVFLSMPFVEEPIASLNFVVFWSAIAGVLIFSSSITRFQKFKRCDENAERRDSVASLNVGFFNRAFESSSVSLVSTPMFSSPRGSRFFTQSVSADAALQALAGVVWRALLMGALLKEAQQTFSASSRPSSTRGRSYGDRGLCWCLTLCVGSLLSPSER